MPIRFNAISNDSPSIPFANIVGPIFQECNGAYMAADKIHFVGRSEMIDRKTGDLIGHYVYTMCIHPEESFHELLDVDIVLCAPAPTKLQFITKKAESSDSNEYYDVEIPNTAQRLLVETVNRYAIEGEVEGTEQDVYISAFPYKLSVYKNIDEFNKTMGFKKAHPIGKTGLKTGGLSSTFTAPGGALSSSDATSTGSMVIGTVENFRDVSIDVGEVRYDFVLAQVSTALGSIPVAMGREVFDLRKLRKGKLVAMFADIKADMAKPDTFAR